MRSPDSSPDLRRLIESEGLDVEIVRLDVTDDDSVRAALREALDRDGRVDAVVNNAGVGPFAPLEHASDRHWLETLDTNLLGPVRVTRAVLPQTRAQGAGIVVNISSVAGRMASIPTQSAYAASKHAPCAFTDAVNAECASFGIRAVCIEPGSFATAIMDKDTIAHLPADDPYKAVADRIEQFFRASVAAAPSPEVVAEVVRDALDGKLAPGSHHPVGVAGLHPTDSSART
jgi:NAD(P)-dependent dehydrogenase (short-subunit alcohol dehydrogenase family)